MAAKRIVKCPICQKEFESESPRRKYCSLTCRESGRVLVKLKWEMEHPKYMRDYMRKYNHRNGK